LKKNKRKDKIKTGKNKGGLIKMILKLLIVAGIAYLYWENHKKRSTLMWDYELRKKVSYILVADFRARDEDIMDFFTHKTYKKYMKTYKGEQFLSKEQIDELGKSYIEYLKSKKNQK